MEKHLKIIIIVGVIIILVFAYLILDMLFDKTKSGTQQGHTTNGSAETVYNTDDYVISQSINVYPDAGAKLGEKNSRILAKLESIEQTNGEVTGFNVLDMEDNSYEVAVNDMNLINLDYNGVDEANLAFRTGGSVRLVVGSYLYLYKTWRQYLVV